MVDPCDKLVIAVSTRAMWDLFFSFYLYIYTCKKRKKQIKEIKVNTINNTTQNEINKLKEEINMRDHLDKGFSEILAECFKDLTSEEQNKKGKW